MQLSDLYLRFLVNQGLQKKFGDNPHLKDLYIPRAKYELDIFEQVGISDYFLILWGIVEYCKRNDIPTGPGRGSAAGCLVSYLIGITMLDPIYHGLIFERFYNPGRMETKELPDIDLDVSKENRDKIINEYIIPTYGADHVAPIGTANELQSKGAVKDLARTLGIPVAVSEDISSIFDVHRGNVQTLDEVINEKDDNGLPSKKAQKIVKYKKAYPELFKWLPIIEKMAPIRALSVHAAGIVIAPTPVGEFVPLRWNPSKQMACTDYDMHELAVTGALKLDLLGLRTLDVIQGAIKRAGIKETFHDFIEKIPTDDADVYTHLRKGFGVGVFQFESPFMRSLLRDVQPYNLEDLSAINALGRPGPLDAQVDISDDIVYDKDGNKGAWLASKKRNTLNMIEVYIARKCGELRVTYLHESLEPILKNTYGVIVYQEQVMQIAQQIAGYSLADADKLRKIVGKKLLDKMPEQEEKFTNGCIEGGVPKDAAHAIWEQIKTFAAYGFNKSHSMSYSVLAYITAYMKIKYPAEFMAALISSEDKIEKRQQWIHEARENLGIKVTAPDINRSEADFVAFKDEILFGFREVKGLGTVAVRELIRTRGKQQFESMKDFYNRIDMQQCNAARFKALVAANAFRDIHPNKAELLEWDKEIRDRRQKLNGKIKRRQERIPQLQAELLNIREDPDGKITANVQKKLTKAQTELLELQNEDLTKDLPPVAPINLEASLKMEEEVLGVQLSGTLASPFVTQIAMYGQVTVADLKDEEFNSSYADDMCGVLNNIRPHVVKSGKFKGDEMAYCQFVDLTGTMDMIIFPSLYKEKKKIIATSKPFLVRARKSTQDQAIICLGIQEV